MIEDHHKNSDYLLHENKYGFIFECEECDELLISFNNVLVNMDKNHFFRLKSIINNISKEKEEHLYDIPNQKERKILINTIDEKLNFCFDMNEFKYLEDLVNQSAYMLNIKKLFQNKSNK
jgi:hypothetical protein